MEETKVKKGSVIKRIDKKDLPDFISAGWKETIVLDNPYSNIYGKK